MPKDVIEYSLQDTKASMHPISSIETASVLIAQLVRNRISSTASWDLFRTKLPHRVHKINNGVVTIDTMFE